jgi:serine/threonine protein kinase
LHELAILTALRGHPFISSLVATPHRANGTLPESLELVMGNHVHCDEYYAPCTSHQILANRFGLVFERAPLGDMDAFIQANKLAAVPLSQRRAWIGQLAQALAFCHQRGIVHRDLSTKNVLIVSDTRVQLTDFGLARWSTPACEAVTRFFELFPKTRRDLTPRLHSDILGASIYASPEVLMGASFIGTRADVWSFGMLAFEIGTGGSHLLELDDNYISENEVREPIWLGALRSLFRAHPVRLMPDHPLFDQPRMSRRVPASAGLWFEKRTGKDWAGWFRHALRPPRPSSDEDVTLLNDFFSHVFEWTPEQRVDMPWVARHAWIHNASDPPASPSPAALARVPFSPPEPGWVQAHPTYSTTRCILHDIFQSLERYVPGRVVRLHEWMWGAVVRLQRVIEKVPTDLSDPEALATALFVWMILLRPIETNDALKRLMVQRPINRETMIRLLDLFFVVLGDFDTLYETPFDTLVCATQGDPLEMRALTRELIERSQALLDR